METETVTGRLIGSESRDAMNSGLYELQNAARALLFGKMLDEAIGMVKAFRSDFYHDADWMRRYLKDEDNSFYFGYREYGTSIGTELAAVDFGNDVVLYVKLWLERTSEWSGDWHYSFEQIKG